ncbi:MAG: suppressor of fused domain protein [Myxococcales bacterium]|nr:suppressor of fused domain protein [Myxococcales bacterium]
MAIAPPADSHAASSDGPNANVIFEEVSPYGNRMAIVEDDGRAVYLHLVGPEGSEVETVSLWLRNRGPAPMGLPEDWEHGDQGPALPFEACGHPVGLPPFDAESLNAIWFPEGDAVALREGESVIGVIPPWVGSSDCPGYARDCKMPTPIAWPLKRAHAPGAPHPGAAVAPDGPVSATGNPVLDRVEAAAAFWSDWQGGTPWAPLQQDLVAAYEAALPSAAGRHRYYSVDAGHWPPRFLLEARGADTAVYASGGMCIRPQPLVDRYYENPETVRHVELALSLDAALVPETPMGALNHLSQLLVMPWTLGGWLGTGHTVPARHLPVGPSGTVFSTFLVHGDPPGALPVTFPSYRGAPVKLLWLIPITEAERQYAVESGSEALCERLFAAGVTARHGDRRSVV